MSTKILFDKVVKRYGDNTVIPPLSLEVNPTEFFTLLGPSGCGKTTLLRMVAGFNSVEEGTIKFNENVITNARPQDRNIGMVFQNYAIFPHLTVEKNIAFGLEYRKEKLTKEDINKKVETILKTVQIDQFRNRLPENLSGGQQQRVALARAIVIEPDVLLMDEPLSNLDAKLRLDMRNAIRDIQKSIGITTIYVTHDQEEAMAVSDRIAVMNLGVIQHLGTPQNIYHRPANVFVATFIGRSNILERTLTYKNKTWILEFSSDYHVPINNITIDPIETSQKVKISVRPEEFVITDDVDGIKATVIDSQFLGLNTHYRLQLDNGEEIEIVQESVIQKIIQPGTSVGVKVQIQKINIFDYETEESITLGVENDA